MSEFLTVVEVAAVMHVDPETVTQWCRDGLIDGAFKTPGGHWRIPRTALDAMIGAPQTSRPGTPSGPNIGPGSQDQP